MKRESYPSIRALVEANYLNGNLQEPIKEQREGQSKSDFEIEVQESKSYDRQHWEELFDDYTCIIFKLSNVPKEKRRNYWTQTNFDLLLKELKDINEPDNIWHGSTTENLFHLFFSIQIWQGVELLRKPEFHPYFFDKVYDSNVQEFLKKHPLAKEFDWIIKAKEMFPEKMVNKEKIKNEDNLYLIRCWIGYLDDKLLNRGTKNEPITSKGKEYSLRQVCIAYHCMGIPITDKIASKLLEAHTRFTSVDKLLQKVITKTSDLIALSENKTSDTKHKNDLQAAKRLILGKKNTKGRTSITHVIQQFEANYNSRY